MSGWYGLADKAVRNRMVAGSKLAAGGFAFRAATLPLQCSPT